MNPVTALTLETRAVRFELEVPIEAPLEDVWETVVCRPDAWWVSDLRCLGGSRVELEPRAGGSLVERGEAGASLLWFTVLAVQPPRSLNLAGSLAPPYGGPCQTYLLIQLEERGATTSVRMTVSMHGHVDEAALPEMESGWRLLLEQGLKRAVEAG